MTVRPLRRVVSSLLATLALAAASPRRAAACTITCSHGALIDDQITLPFVAPSGVQGLIIGRIDGRRASGVYTVGNERGTWTGTLDRTVR